MIYDIIIIGGGAAGLMAAYGCKGTNKSVLVLEKMPRVGRKIMITGKGRCNLTNVKEWNDFSTHIRTKINFIRPAFYNLTPQKLIEQFENAGMEVVIERGDRAYPKSMKSSSVIDTLIKMISDKNILINCNNTVDNIDYNNESKIFNILCKNTTYSCKKLIISTGGLTYPGTGSTGDGYKFAQQLGHSIKQCFPSLTAMVPRGYKQVENNQKGHIPRNTKLTEVAKILCGVQLKNVNISLLANDIEIQKEFGDIYFTDGGIEGPIGFKVSRNCVKSIINGAKTKVIIDLKTTETEQELIKRIKSKWEEIRPDKNLKKSYFSLLTKLIPFNMANGFIKLYPDIIKGKKGNERIDFDLLSHRLKNMEFDIIGYVGYERAVITAGGVDTDEVIAKTMQSKKIENLYLCGEVLDIDADTGGYNLHLAFATGYLAGINACKSDNS